jgi:hypothetical protein
MKLDATTGLAYEARHDLAQGTGYQISNRKVMIMTNVMLVLLSLFNPASTTYVKHFILI